MAFFYHPFLAGYAKPNLIFTKQGHEGAGGGDKKRRKEKPTRPLLPLRQVQMMLLRKAPALPFVQRKTQVIFC